ncbi:MAG: hypothetical protein QOE97_770 [Pseudonocardiales bacterium]|nr:hypothetical protein [Pseudonocardiales bacterium]
MGRKKIRLPAGVEAALDNALDQALRIQRPVVLGYLDRMRGKQPNATPAEVIDQLERRYRAAVIAIGGASGAAAAVPGAGTAAAIASGAAEITAFVSATAMYVLGVAEIHGLPVSDPDLRRALVLSVLVGEGAGAAIAGAAGVSPHWAQVIGRSNSREKIVGINGRLGQLLLTRFASRQGALLVGRALPLGIGVGIGAAGNAALAKTAVKAARSAFGPAPAKFPPRIVDVHPVRD